MMRAEYAQIVPVKQKNVCFPLMALFEFTYLISSCQAKHSYLLFSELSLHEGQPIRGKLAKGEGRFKDGG